MMCVEMLFAGDVSTARERQVLELCLLQVHLHIRRDECPGDGGDSTVVHLVLNPWFSAHTCSALQGSI